MHVLLYKDEYSLTLLFPSQCVHHKFYTFLSQEFSSCFSNAISLTLLFANVCFKMCSFGLLVQLMSYCVYKLITDFVFDLSYDIGYNFAAWSQHQVLGWHTLL
ncbi:hypothetical protein N665_0181s0098 [Sinapis alba]|nr:hypothetical protein N665_0181s0098 [Sinapis alba]